MFDCCFPLALAQSRSYDSSDSCNVLHAAPSAIQSALHLTSCYLYASRLIVVRQCPQAKHHCGRRTITMIQ